jgi:hypothetical protein
LAAWERSESDDALSDGLHGPPDMTGIPTPQDAEYVSNIVIPRGEIEN